MNKKNQQACASINNEKYRETDVNLLLSQTAGKAVMILDAILKGDDCLC
jgi:hypothetical protein